MKTMNFDALRTALKAVLDVGITQTSLACKARGDAESVLANSYPQEIENAALAKARWLHIEFQHRDVATAPTTFPEALTAYGTSLLGQVLDENQKLLTEYVETNSLNPTGARESIPRG